MRRRVTKAGLTGCVAFAAAALLSAPALASWSSHRPGGAQGRDGVIAFRLRAGFERGEEGAAQAFGAGRDGQQQGFGGVQGQPAQPAGRGTQSEGSTQGQGTTSGQSAPQTTPGAPGSVVSAEGVVQSLSSTAITVRQLDGSVVAVPLGRQTVLLVDGKTARASQIRAGDVLVATWTSGQAPAIVHLYSAS